MREKILRSFFASDLTVDEFERLGTIVASIGAAQIKSKQAALGAMLSRVASGDMAALPRAFHLACAHTGRLAERHRWSFRRVRDLVALSFKRHFYPWCQSCDGVGKMGGYDGKVVAICHACRGRCKVVDYGFERRILGLDRSAYSRLDIDDRLDDLVDKWGAAEGRLAARTRRQAREIAFVEPA